MCLVQEVPYGTDHMQELFAWTHALCDRWNCSSLQIVLGVPSRLVFPCGSIIDLSVGGSATSDYTQCYHANFVSKITQALADLHSTGGILYLF